MKKIWLGITTTNNTSLSTHVLICIKKNILRATIEQKMIKKPEEEKKPIARCEHNTKITGLGYIFLTHLSKQVNSTRHNTFIKRNGLKFQF